MIEVIYSGETREPKAQEKGILAALKNIRQIGNAGKTTRIYVEDCVMGFLERQMQKKDPQVATLLGKESQENGITYIFVNGALLPEGIKVKGETLDFSSQAFLDLYEDAEKYFPQSEILGWYLPAYEMIGKYGASLGQNSRLFLLEDPTESEEIFYLWEQNHLLKQDGYYIYYQRNEAMKTYMQMRKEKAEERVSKRKTWAVVEGSDEACEREQVERSKMPSKNDRTQKGDRVSQNAEAVYGKGTIDERTKRTAKENSISRNSVTTKNTWKEALKGAFEKKEYDDFVDDYEEMEKSGAFDMSQPKLTTFLYGASTVLAIVVLVIGITLMNNYEKMYEMQEAIETIAMTITETQNGEGGAVEKNRGNIKGAIDDEQETESSQSGGEDSQEVTDQAEKTQTEEGQGIDEQANENGQLEGGQTSEKTEGGTAGEKQTTKASSIEDTVADLGHRYYVIQEGDTLASISRKMYQTTDKVEEIKQLNEGINENELNVGQKIILP